MIDENIVNEVFPKKGFIKNLEILPDSSDLITPVQKKLIETLTKLGPSPRKVLVDYLNLPRTTDLKNDPVFLSTFPIGEDETKQWLKDKIDDLNRERANLEKYYKKRYQLILIFTLLVFILGLLAIYTEGHIVNIGSVNFPINMLYLIVILVPIGLIFKNLIDVYKREEKFIIQILDAWDSIEGN